MTDEFAAFIRDMERSIVTKPALLTSDHAYLTNREVIVDLLLRTRREIRGMLTEPNTRNNIYLGNHYITEALKRLREEFP